MFGRYTYQDIPKSAFPYFVKAYEQDTYSYFIASPEKALCDLLYKLPPVNGVKELEQLLFENLRINIDEFEQLYFKDIIFLASKYISNNIRFLAKLIGRKYYRNNY